MGRFYGNNFIWFLCQFFNFGIFFIDVIVLCRYCFTRFYYGRTYDITNFLISDQDKTFNTASSFWWIHCNPTFSIYHEDWNGEKNCYYFFCLLLFKTISHIKNPLDIFQAWQSAVHYAFLALNPEFVKKIRKIYILVKSVMHSVLKYVPISTYTVFWILAVSL